MDIESIAKVCHEANRAYCESLGDFSNGKWTSVLEHFRRMTRNGVAFHMANPDATAAASHENWMKGKLADGWKYGPTKDLSSKTHPLLVPFDQLPPEHQAKDKLFKAIVDALR